MGKVSLGFPDGVITRHQVQGLWYQRKLAFDAKKLRIGDNTLTVPAGSINDGVVYDCLRLEVK